MEVEVTPVCGLCVMYNASVATFFLGLLTSPRFFAYVICT